MSILVKSSCALLFGILTMMCDAYADEYKREIVQDRIDSSEFVVIVTLEKYLGWGYEVEAFSENIRTLHKYRVSSVSFEKGNFSYDMICLAEQFDIGSEIVLLRSNFEIDKTDIALQKAIDSNCHNGEVFFDSTFNNEVIPVKKIFINDRFVKYLEVSSVLYMVNESCGKCLSKEIVIEGEDTGVRRESRILVPMKMVFSDSE